MIKCPYCKFTCFTQYDLEAHNGWHKRSLVENERENLEKRWMQTKNKDIEMLPKSQAPSMVRQIENGGNLKAGGFSHWLYGDFIFRKRLRSI